MTFPLKTMAAVCAIALSLSAGQQIARAADMAGVRQIVVPSKERGVDLDVTVWYPASPGGKSLTLGENMFFAGTPAMLDAPIAAGRFPLVLVSHGAGIAGTAMALSWIAAPLAQQGFVVAAPTHPGNGGPKRSAAETMKLWLRPADIVEALSAMEKDAAFAPHLDAGKVGVLGLSMGGSTALAIAGGRMDPARLSGYCDTDRLNPSLCGWLRQSGVDLHRLDMQSAGRDNQDRRVRFAMVIDPAPVDVFKPDSFSRISIPVDIINLGRPGKIPQTDDASDIAKVIPDARYETIEDASHYSMFAVCKPGAAEMVEEEKIGDPLCSDGDGRSRADIHVQLIDMTTKAFNRALKPGH